MREKSIFVVHVSVFIFLVAGFYYRGLYACARYIHICEIIFYLETEQEEFKMTEINVKQQVEKRMEMIWKILEIDLGVIPKAIESGEIKRLERLLKVWEGGLDDLAQIKTKVQVQMIENDVESSEIELWKQNLERKMAMLI